MLKRFWFKFCPQPFSNLNLGCGVTAYDYHDAVKLMKERIFINDPMPEVVTVIEDVDIGTLDQKHVISNMEACVFRGIWFPRGYSELE